MVLSAKLGGTSIHFCKAQSHEIASSCNTWSSSSQILNYYNPQYLGSILHCSHQPTWVYFTQCSSADPWRTVHLAPLPLAFWTYLRWPGARWSTGWIHDCCESLCNGYASRPFLASRFHGFQWRVSVKFKNAPTSHNATLRHEVFWGGKAHIPCGALTGNLTFSSSSFFFKVGALQNAAQNSAKTWTDESQEWSSS